MTIVPFTHRSYHTDKSAVLSLIRDRFTLFVFDRRDRHNVQHRTLDSPRRRAVMKGIKPTPLHDSCPVSIGATTYATRHLNLYFTTWALIPFSDMPTCDNGHKRQRTTRLPPARGAASARAGARRPGRGQERRAEAPHRHTGLKYEDTGYRTAYTCYTLHTPHDEGNLKFTYMYESSLLHLCHVTR